MNTYLPIDLSFDVNVEFILDEEVYAINDFTWLTVCLLKEAGNNRKIKGYSKLRKAEPLDKPREWEALKRAEVQSLIATQLAQNE
jgi:hypothetical protein